MANPQLVTYRAGGEWEGGEGLYFIAWAAYFEK